MISPQAVRYMESNRSVSCVYYLCKPVNSKLYSCKKYSTAKAALATHHRDSTVIPMRDYYPMFMQKLILTYRINKLLAKDVQIEE